jgi:hypothetical protein
MKTGSRLLLLAAAGALAVPLLFAVATRAGDPEPRADAGSADAESPLDGGEDADADAAPPLPSYRAEPFPEEHSAEPKPKEWASAPKVAIDRPSPCEARRLREWMRLHCELSAGAIALLGGDVDGLAMRLDPDVQDVMFPEGAAIVFPVRRGDRRVIELLQASFGYRGASGIEPYLVLSELWLPGDDQPTILLE